MNEDDPCEHLNWIWMWS